MPTSQDVGTWARDSGWALGVDSSFHVPAVPVASAFRRKVSSGFRIEGVEIAQLLSVTGVRPLFGKWGQTPLRTPARTRRACGPFCAVDTASVVTAGGREADARTAALREGGRLWRGSRIGNEARSHTDVSRAV